MDIISGVTSNLNIASSLILVNLQENAGIKPQDTSDKKFLFHIIGEEQVMLEADITDHYAEDNASMNDHVAIRPTIVTTHGYVGELNNVTPEELGKYPGLIAEKLTVLGAYTPELTTAALIAYNTAFQLYQVGKSALRSVTSIIDSAMGEDTQTEQQKAYNKFKLWFKARLLFTVQTPWEVHKNMAIRSLRAIQDADTNVVTDFEITFKEMRFASEAVTTVNGYETGENGSGRYSDNKKPKIMNTNILKDSQLDFIDQIGNL